MLVNFDTFTPTAMEVIALASQKASVGCNNEIKPEHLFLSIFDSNKGCGSKIQQNISPEIATLVEEVQQASKAVNQPNNQTTVRIKPYVCKEVRLSKGTKLVMRRAIGKAKAMRHGCVGTEHIVLGLIGEPSNDLGLLIDKLGIDRGELCKRIENLVF